ncbi:25308_t:CDS:1, partial [Gigaspora rosea]
SLSSRFNSANAEIVRYKIKETSTISDKQRDTKPNSFINEGAAYVRRLLT